MPVLKFNKCDYDCSDKRNKRGDFRVYCRRLDKKCKPTISPTTPALVPLPKLPPINTRPKRFYKNNDFFFNNYCFKKDEKEYIGIGFKREEHGQWVESLNIKRFSGRPYSIYDHDIIIEYTDPIWEALIARVEYAKNNARLRLSEGAQPGREVVIKRDYAYSIAPIVTLQ